jgi:NAD(P)-dependent dehydrogenase (short-subunit alcohol dehydrogenase family)
MRNEYSFRMGLNPIIQYREENTMMTRKTNINNKPWSLDSLPQLQGKVFIITGANSGIGFEAARVFARTGGRVVLACRSARKAQAAIDHICSETPQATVEFMELDLASLASIRAFAQKALERLPGIDVLCNNAGVMSIPYRHYSQTQDGFEMHFGINHLGHFALTGLLFEKIIQSAPARIVTVSSAAHKIGNPDINFDDLQGTRDFSQMYGKSKLANLLFTYELDRRLRARNLDVSAVACHPGTTKSNLISTGPEMTQSKPVWWLKLAYLPAQSAAMGALNEIYAAVGEDIEGGNYIGPSGHLESRGLPTKVQSNERSHDAEVAKTLWAASEALTGVRFLD